MMKMVISPRSGSLDHELLNKLNSLAYYQLPYPKSTGYEWFTGEIVPLIEASNSSNEDLLHTFIHHNCEQIAIDVLKHKGQSKSKLLATGGGALNQFFMDTLQDKLGPDIEVIVPNKTLIGYKEALIFALMGVLRLEGKTNVLKSVTGATSDSCSGEVFFPQGD